QISLPKSKPLIALHPGSKDTFKRWPAEHFIAVGRALEHHGYQILLTGTHNELSLMQHIASHIPGASCANPTLSLRSFAALLSHVDLLISNDTGPVHLACALQRPVIALYAPLDPAHCGPHKAPQATTIAKRTSCQPCLKRKCQKPFCLLQIGPTEVIEAALTKNLA
ncbi:MAG: glycosyltransferase family 9 protein, partial [Verrucomicrobiota bacterium]|nr:glycosyltransferase family 9 protein [Verrucomicrobiota bacterium]